MKRPIFQEVMLRENRWLIARAVLMSVPNFDDGKPGRLPALKALAARCLAKDLDARLALVKWEDFPELLEDDPLTRVKARLQKTSPVAGSRLSFERSQAEQKVVQSFREELISSYGPQVPVQFSHLTGAANQPYPCVLKLNSRCSIHFEISFKWGCGIYERLATIQIGQSPVCEFAIDSETTEALVALTTSSALMLEEAMNMLENSTAAVSYDGVKLSNGCGQLKVIAE